MRRLLLVVAVVATLVLAGCATGGIDDGSIDADDGDGVGDETTNETDDGDGDDDRDANGTTDDVEDETDGDGDATGGDGDATGGDGADDETGDGSAAAVDGELEVHHLDVGQADATLVVAPSGETMLVDSGGWQADGADVIAHLEALGVDRIDHLVATHGHADHIGGHAAVIEYLETDGEGVGTVYDSGVPHTSATFERYLDAVEAHDVRLIEVAAGDAVSLGDATVEFYNPPEGAARDETHDDGVVLAVEFGSVRYLTTGDAEVETERRLVETYGDDLAADVYQAGHHGSSTSSSDAFLDAVDPSVAVVSSATDSQYGHPHDETLEAFDARGVETYWTAVHGDVVVRTDGETVAVDPEREDSADPGDLLAEKRDAQAALADPFVDVPGARTGAP